MNQTYRNVNDILNSLFENISKKELNNVMNMKKGWKSVVSSIKSKKNKSIGEILEAHSRPVELKNNILLIETDHPGYIQTLQMYNSYILKGINYKFPELNIKTLSYRLKGSNIKIKECKKEENIDKKELKEPLVIRDDICDELKEKFYKIKMEIENRYIDQK